jgi:perosamine synthetase
MTFAASANCIVYQGGTPIFVDVSPDTLLIDPDKIEEKITPRTKALIVVDYAGHPCDYDTLWEIATRHHIAIVADGCHALGAEYKNRKVGSLANMTAFSFHPVKHITTGEGGMITTDNENLARRMRIFRNHGITTDHRQREAQGSWIYEMVDLGYNYRITDFQCALGMNQLKKNSGWVTRRRNIAAQYDSAFADIERITPLAVGENVHHAYHLYVVRTGVNERGPERAKIFKVLHEHGIGVNVHYIPVHLHPFYRNRFKTGPGLCPVAEAAYESILSLPMFPAMSDADVSRVIEIITSIVMSFAE